MFRARVGDDYTGQQKKYFFLLPTKFEQILWFWGVLNPMAQSVSANWLSFRRYSSAPKNPKKANLALIIVQSTLKKIYKNRFYSP